MIDSTAIEADALAVVSALLLAALEGDGDPGDALAIIEAHPDPKSLALATASEAARVHATWSASLGLTEEGAVTVWREMTAGWTELREGRLW